MDTASNSTPSPDVADLRHCIAHRKPVNRCTPACWSWYLKTLGQLCAAEYALQRARTNQKTQGGSRVPGRGPLESTPAHPASVAAQGA